ncbi:ATP-grasp domain-containing protein [Streptomyces sp. NPDC048521]|uniref:ATP-grasp domain-containing protein n=1 Tax=Streptomyces sp. NPDC048521 TaxID=3365566 RepID=UPI003719E8BA
MAHLVLVESTTTAGFQILRTASALGHEVTFVAHDLAPYLVTSGAQAALRSAARVRSGVSTGEADALTRALAKLHEERPIDGFLPLSDGHLLPTALAARQLGIPHEAPETIACLRDKHAMRTALRRAGVPQPDFRSATTEQEAVAAASALGYPVVVKPADGMSSLHVGVAGTPDEVRTLARAITRAEGYGRGIRSSGRILVERFVPGPVISCETVTADGRHQVYGCVDRRMADGPFPVELGGCFPADLPGSTLEEVARVCLEALDAVGLRRSHAHTELVLGPQGPQIIEINGRLIGGLVPTMMNHVLDGDIYEDVIALALGHRPSVPATTGVGCIRSVTAPATGVLTAIDAQEAWSVPGVREVVLHARPGRPVRPARDNLDRLAFIITTGPSARTARAAADDAHARIRVDVDTADDVPLGHVMEPVHE